jgi:hypothetical protein
MAPPQEAERPTLSQKADVGRPHGMFGNHHPFRGSVWPTRYMSERLRFVPPSVDFDPRLANELARWEERNSSTLKSAVLYYAISKEARPTTGARTMRSRGLFRKTSSGGWQRNSDIQPSDVRDSLSVDRGRVRSNLASAVSTVGTAVPVQIFHDLGPQLDHP